MEKQIKKNVKKENRGITLIALVVTIIVLLILAGISIGMLTGNNGILKQARSARTETDNASIEEQIKIAYLGSFGSKGEIDGTSLIKNLNSINGVTAAGPLANGKISFPVIITTEKDMYEMDSEGKLKELVPGLYYADSDEMILTWDELFDTNIGNKMLSKDDTGKVLSRYAFDLSAVTDKNGLNVGSTGKNVKLIVDKSITSITGMASLTKLEEIILSPTITSISAGCFTGCSALKKAIIPSGNIGASAFYNLTNLEKVALGNQVTTIGNSVFSRCSKLTSIEIPDSVTTLGTGIFDSCSSLDTIVVGNGVTSITSATLLTGSCNVKNITLGNGITEIPDNMFSNKFQYLEKVKIGDSVTRIGSYAFNYCLNLKEINISNTLTNIGDYAFWDCRSLTKIVLPNSLTSLGSTVFKRCYGLKNVTVGTGLTSLPYWSFYDCTGLESITIPTNITSIDNGVFGGCNKLKDIYYTGTQEQWGQITINSENNTRLSSPELTIHYNSSMSN